MIDDTEPVRRAMIAEQRANGPLTYSELAVQYGEVYNTADLMDSFEVIDFLAPIVAVRRKSDGQKGSLEFQHMPRFYYNWKPHQP